MSLDAGENEGTLLTRPFVLPAGELHVNAAMKDGSLRVAVCGEKGVPIKGFDESSEIRADKTAIHVRWLDKLERLRGQTVRLRFTLERGKLYSFWFGERRSVPYRQASRRSTNWRRGVGAVATRERQPMAHWKKELTLLPTPAANQPASEGHAEPTPVGLPEP